MAFYTYLMASAPYGTLYCGQTDNLIARVRQHKTGLRPGFTTKYEIHLLVWYAVHETREGARLHERQIKKWNRAWKVRLIEENNRNWRDLADELIW